MATERKLAGKKLPLTVAFAVLLVAAFGAGCNGFFQSPTLTSITINGPTSVQVGSTITMTAFGVNSDGQGSTLQSGVSWSSDTPDVAAITGSCASQPCGGVTIQGVAAGQASISANDQSVQNSVTLNVVLPGVTNFEVCQGTFGSTDCSSGSTPLTWVVTIANGGQTQTFVSQGVSDGKEFDVTPESSWQLASGAPSTISCSNDGTSPETCSVDSGTAIGTYPVTITYGTNPVVTATLNIKVQ